jgi:hypothetical protein
MRVVIRNAEIIDSFQPVLLILDPATNLALLFPLAAGA